MLEFLINALNVKTITALFAGVAAAATVLTLAMPFVFVDSLDKRMRAVALEREKIRQRERERLAQEGQKAKLRQSSKQTSRLLSTASTSPNGSVRKRRGSSSSRPGIAVRRPT